MPEQPNKPEDGNLTMSERLAKLRPASAPSRVVDRGNVDPMKVSRTPTFRATVADIRNAIASNPDNVIAIDMAKGVVGLADDFIVTVDRTDLEALLDNKRVVTDEKIEVIGGRNTIIKTKRVVAMEDEKGAEKVILVGPAGSSTLQDGHIGKGDRADISHGGIPQDPKVPDNFNRVDPPLP